LEIPIHEAINPVRELARLVTMFTNNVLLLRTTIAHPAILIIADDLPKTTLNDLRPLPLPTPPSTYPLALTNTVVRDLKGAMTL
jgi:hypothetical protein